MNGSDVLVHLSIEENKVPGTKKHEHFRHILLLDFNRETKASETAKTIYEVYRKLEKIPQERVSHALR